MNNFSIKDIERLSGIKAHTLRIWEQRHGLRLGKRKESQHRYYDNEDLKQILRISYLYHHGYKISRICSLSNDEIVQLATTSLGENNFDLFINQMVEAGIDMDGVRFDKVIENAMQLLGFENTVIKVLYPFFEKIGLLWMTEHIIPAHEHFCSYLIQTRILIAIDELGPVIPATEDKVIIFSPEGEMHEIPLLVAQHLLKKRGIQTVFFGANTSIQELEYYCTHQPATHLYFHFITNFQVREPTEYINSLLEKCPGKKIICSGPQLAGIDHPSNQVHILSSLKDTFEISRLF